MAEHTISEVTNRKSFVASSILQNLLLLFSTIIISLLIVEILMQIFIGNPFNSSYADKMLKIRIPHANVDNVFDRSRIAQTENQVRYRTNNRGYIEPTASHINPNHTIVFMGGSTTEASAVSESLRFPVLVSTKLARKGLKVNTLNIGRSGGTLHDTVNVLFNHVVEDNPDYAVVMHSTNDIGILNYYGGYHPRMGENVSYKNVIKYLMQIISTKSAIFGNLRKYWTFEAFEKGTFKRREITKEYATQFRSRLEIFVSMCRAFHIKPILMTQPLSTSVKTSLTPEWIDENAQTLFNNTIREVAESLSVELIDLEHHINELVAQSKDDKTRKKKLGAIFYDGMHVTDNGSKIYAEFISDSLYELIANKNPQPNK